MFQEGLIKHIAQASKEFRVSRCSYNTIDYILITESDGWISIIQYREGIYKALLQACNAEKAHEYCSLREPCSVSVNILC